MVASETPLSTPHGAVSSGQVAALCDERRLTKCSHQDRVALALSSQVLEKKKSRRSYSHPALTLVLISTPSPTNNLLQP